MRFWLLLVLGLLAVLFGVVWTLQGLDLLGADGGMNGQPVWAVIGPIVAIVGLVLAWLGVRARRGAGAPPPA
jgi:hypothetical protein